MTVCYLDASALVKLATQEVETAALRRHLTSYETRTTSRVATVEVPRALARKAADEGDRAAVAWGALVERLVVMELDGAVAATAAGLGPPTLRSLDAIHLASALSIESELDAFITYDTRLADAARANGLTVVAPA